jgi:hypothetical protein
VTISRAEVIAFRREFQAPGIVGYGGLRSLAEILAVRIHQSREEGADRAKMLRDIELLLRGTSQDAASIREARNILTMLAYPTDIIKLLTALARRAPLPPVWRPPGRGGERSHAERRTAQAAQVDHGSLAMWTQPKKRRGRR